MIVDLPHYTADTRVEQGKAMVSLMAYDKMYMDINLPESSIRYVEGSATGIYYSLYHPWRYFKSESGWSCSCNQYGDTYFKGKILIDNDQLKLRPGMFAKADIIVDRADSSIIIPKDVILSDRGTEIRIYQSKRIRQRYAICKQVWRMNIISKFYPGLNVNDNLVVKGFETLKEDAKVKIQK